MFPQDGFIRLLRLESRQWSSIDTGAHSTWDATWTADDLIALLDPERAVASSGVRRDGQRVPPARATDDLIPRRGRGSLRTATTFAWGISGRRATPRARTCRSHPRCTCHLDSPTGSGWRPRRT